MSSVAATDKKPEKDKMKPESYLAAARRMRELAARIEETANARTPQEVRSRTRVVNAAAQLVKLLALRNAASVQGGPATGDSSQFEGTEENAVNDGAMTPVARIEDVFEPRRSTKSM